MGLGRHQAKGLESIISACLLAILLLIGVWVFIKQFDFDISRFGIDAAAVHQLPAKLEPDKKEKMVLSSLLPSGFETVAGIKVYDSENLYEKINGKAGFYIESGFKKLFTLRFVSKSRKELWFELYLYDMGAAKNAFSVYSVQRRAGAKDLPGFTFGYKTDNALYSANGRYYIELIGSAESGELLKAMTEICQGLQADLAVEGDIEIAELKLFGRENLVPGSIKLYLTAAFGFEELTETFTAKYKIDNEIVTAFLSERPDSMDAKATAKGYQSFLIENGAVTKSTANKILEGRVFDFYGSVEIVFAVGPFAAGVHEAKEQQPAEKLAIKLINKLTEATKAVSND